MSKVKNLIGKRGEDYHGIKGTIIDAVLMKDWENINHYDGSGWMGGEEFDEMLEDYNPEKDILVAFEDDNEHSGSCGDTAIQVFVYGGEGVVELKGEENEKS